jgi:hypothetical protein
MRTTTRSAGSRNRKTQNADGNQDDAGKHLARAMKFAKKFSPKKEAKLGVITENGGAKNDDRVFCIAVSGDKGDEMNKTVEVSA